MTAARHLPISPIAAGFALAALLAACGAEPLPVAGPATNTQTAAGDLPLARDVTGAIPVVEEFTPDSEAPRPTTNVAAETGEPETAPCTGFRFTSESFPTNSWDLTPDAAAQVPLIIDRIRTSGAVGLEIVGHTDIRPSPIGNDELSLRRARAVADALVEGGVREALVDSIIGMGPNQPLDEGDTPDAHERNRRVEVVAHCVTDS